MATQGMAHTTPDVRLWQYEDRQALGLPVLFFQPAELFPKGAVDGLGA
jgi:hypothetical protein